MFVKDTTLTLAMMVMRWVASLVNVISNWWADTVSGVTPPFYTQPKTQKPCGAFCENSWASNMAQRRKKSLKAFHQISMWPGREKAFEIAAAGKTMQLAACLFMYAYCTRIVFVFCTASECPSNTFCNPASWQHGLLRKLHTASLEFSIEFFDFICIAHLMIDIITKKKPKCDPEWASQRQARQGKTPWGDQEPDSKIPSPSGWHG